MRYRGRRGFFYPSYSTLRYLTSWERLGWRYSRGKRMFYNIDPYLCRRFPWLPRFWWTDPDYSTKYFTPLYGVENSKIIEQEIKTIESEITALKKRLGEIQHGKKE
ncbi:DUF5320 domain-containing protein [Candidatus Bathyarchaeota archaeon]|nr:DUF5320 domain-containing protein [Candidatus Bathyarchaeota archaeon]